MLKDAPIVIPDEVTANVDPENEGRLQKAVEALTRDKTILMIAYRLRTVRNVDQILALDGGKIVQKGWHEELIGQPGIYADFVGGKKETDGCDRRKKKDRLCEKAETVFLGAFFRAGLYFGRF